MSLTVLFTRFCRDEISPRDELIHVKKTGMKFHFGIKKKKKRRINTSSRDENLKRAFFFLIFNVCIPNILSKFNMFEHNESMNIMKRKASLQSPKRKMMSTTSKK